MITRGTAVPKGDSAAVCFALAFGQRASRAWPEVKLRVRFSAAGAKGRRRCSLAAAKQSTELCKRK